MSAVPMRPTQWLGEWGALALGLCVLFVPTYYGLANGIWNNEENAHGPIVLAVVLALFWMKRQEWGVVAQPKKGAGLALFGFGLLLYVLGRSQDILIFEVGSEIPIIAGLLLFLRGSGALRAAWFPLFFLIFMLPLPGFLVDAATGPLKQYVSVLAETLLYAAGYPIARSGVMLSIGPYQLLVADACSGLNSMFSLSAMGLLYLHLGRHSNWLRNGIIIAAILPIAFVANITRVIALVLITYYLGDEAGQGFLHGFASVLLFVVALLLLFGLDAALGWAMKPRVRS